MEAACRGSFLSSSSSSSSSSLSSMSRTHRSVVYFLVFCIGRVWAPYPMRTLQCWSSLTKPEMNLICPDSRNNWCVKQTSDLKQDLCGKTQYFGDQWDMANGLCYYKKCGYACKEGATTFYYGGQKYTRNEYCCKDKNYCNSSHRLLGSSRTALYIVVSSALATMFFLLG